MALKMSNLIFMKFIFINSYPISHPIHKGATALHVSAAKGYTRVMKLLLQSGANVNALDKDGWTSLHAAAHWEQEEACRILAENGADFSIKTFSDQSIYDVCDSEMVGKLKQLEQASRHLTANGSASHKLADVTSMSNQCSKTEPGSNRNRRASDEYNKSSIVRLTNEAKSTLGDREKRQEKSLLSPVPAANSSAGTNAFEFGNSETENGKSWILVSRWGNALPQFEFSNRTTGQKMFPICK